MKKTAHKPEIKNYQIDDRLKAGKDYPSELELLFDKFLTRKMGPIKTHSKIKRDKYLRQISLIEKTFKEYFLHPVVTLPVEHQRPAIRRDPDTEEISHISDPRDNKFLNPGLKPVFIHELIRRVNARLNYFNPQLSQNIDGSYHLEPFFLDNKKDLFGEAQPWAWLAIAISELDPELVRECAYCGKIYISRQRKKYHQECQKRFFSEKAIREGMAKKRQKEYRERKKDKAGMSKTR